MILWSDWRLILARTPFFSCVPVLRTAIDYRYNHLPICWVGGGGGQLPCVSAEPRCVSPFLGAQRMSAPSALGDLPSRGNLVLKPGEPGYRAVRRTQPVRLAAA